MTDKLILALDLDRADDALALVRRLKPHLSLFKIGNQLFTREGPAIVKAVRAEGVDIFLDQKWHDIPQTVANAVKSAVALDVRYVTIHAGGGLEMMQAAQEAVKGTRTQILAVTVLTSLDDAALRQIGFERTAADQVIHFARLAVKAGVSGLVCSPHEIELIRAQVPEPVTLVTPRRPLRQRRHPGPKAHPLRPRSPQARRQPPRHRPPHHQSPRPRRPPQKPSSPSAACKFPLGGTGSCPSVTLDINAIARPHETLYALGGPGTTGEPVLPGSSRLGGTTGSERGK